MFVSPNISHPFNKSTSTLYSIKLIILLIIIKWKILLIIIKRKRKYVFFGKEKTKQAKNLTNKWSNCFCCWIYFVDVVANTQICITINLFHSENCWTCIYIYEGSLLILVQTYCNWLNRDELK